jgi:hypothetical protein
MVRKQRNNPHQDEYQESLNKILKLGNKSIKENVTLLDFYNAMKLLDLENDQAIRYSMYTRITQALKEPDGVDKSGNKIYKYQRHYPLVIDDDLESELVKMRCGLVDQLREWNITNKDKKNIIELVRKLSDNSPLNLDKDSLCNSISDIILLWTIDTDKDLIECNNKLKKLWTDPKLSKYVVEVLSQKEFDEFAKHYTFLHELTSRWFDPRLYEELMKNTTVCPKNTCATKIEALRVLADLVRRECRSCEKMITEYEKQARHLYVSKDEHPSLIDRIIDIFYF